MNVALSAMMDFRSSERSVTIQSSLRGRIAVSRDIMDLPLRFPISNVSRVWYHDGTLFKDTE